MDPTSTIKTEPCLEDSCKALGTPPFGDSFKKFTSPSPSEYQPSPSPTKLPRSELLPKALSQYDPMEQANGLSNTSKSCRPSAFQGDWLTEQDYEVTEVAYLTYAPARHPDRARWQPAYQANLDELGFKLKGERAIKMRSNFVGDLKAYVEPANAFKYVRQQDHPQEFRKMVLGFVQAHGKKYWGASRRGHLSEPDIRKGFLVPRDAERSNSR